LKRRSDTSYPTPPDLIFFTDRDLGKIFPRILRENGWPVVRYGDHYGERSVTDDEWITFAAQQGYVALSHDRNIRSDPVAIRAVMEGGGRLFVVRGKNLTAPEKAALVLASLGGIHRVLQEQAEAFIAVISRRSMKQGIIKPDVQVRLTLDGWRRGKQLPAENEDLFP